MSKLELRGLDKLYGTLKVVDDVSLSIGDGEFVSLLGHPAAARRRPCA